MTRNAGRKKIIRQRAVLTGISYRQANRMDRAGVAAVLDEPAMPRDFMRQAVDMRRSPIQLVEDRTDSWCGGQMYRSVDSVVDDLGDIVCHPLLEDVTVHELSPERESFEVDVVEEYEGATLALNGSLRAALRIEGFMPYAEAEDAEEEGRVTILVPPFNTRSAQVVDHGRGIVEIAFSALVDHDLQDIEDFEILHVRALEWSR